MRCWLGGDYRPSTSSASVASSASAIRLAVGIDGACLTAPQGDAATVQKIITALDDETADIDNMASATASAEASAIEAAKRAEQTTKATYQGLAQGYGLKVCGAGP